MKLQIKTLNQKSLVVEMEETKTVYELKKELSLYPDIGVKPELQKLIYGGKILADEDKLSAYNINVKKFLVIMTLKQPQEKCQEKPQQNEAQKEQEMKTPKQSGASTASAASTTSNAEIKTPTTVPDKKKDELVSQIVEMGYPEPDVRRALAASFYNVERAIEYLIDGIPQSPPTPEGESFSDSALSETFLPPLDIFRNEPNFHRLRSTLARNPEILDTIVQRFGQSSPALLDLLNEHQEEFLEMMLGDSDCEEDDDIDNM